MEGNHINILEIICYNECAKRKKLICATAHKSTTRPGVVLFFRWMRRPACGLKGSCFNCRLDHSTNNRLKELLRPQKVVRQSEKKIDPYATAPPFRASCQHVLYHLKTLHIVGILMILQIFCYNRTESKINPRWPG